MRRMAFQAKSIAVVLGCSSCFRPLHLLGRLGRSDPSD